MTDYNAVRDICMEHSRISEKVIDKFLLSYAAGQGGLEKKMEQRFKRFRHVTREFQPGWLNMLRAQYLAHSIFKQDGTIKKLLNHVALQRLSREELTFLEQLAETPWRFSFSQIEDEPDKDFFSMIDIFSGEEYLLFSPGVSNHLKENKPILWLNLIGYNGSCWQSYGPIGAYRGYEPEDIFFFASELNPEIENESMILDDIDQNPVPYMMLLLGSNSPLVYHKEDKILQARSYIQVESFDSAGTVDQFISEYNEGVYRFGLKGWNEFPHYAHAFYVEGDGDLVLTAMTDRGYRALAEAFSDMGYDIPENSDIQVNMNMATSAGKILNREISLSEFDGLFEKDVSDGTQEGLDNMNDFIALILPDINAGRQPDVEALAKRFGVDIETAHELVRDLQKRLK